MEERDMVLVDKGALHRLMEAVSILQVGGGEMSFGELSAIRDRLRRIVGHLVDIFPPSETEATGARRKRGPPGAKVPDDGQPMISQLMAECRLFLDQIERILAPRLPRRSSGVPADGWRFLGRQRVGKGQGNAIRADYHRLGEAETLRKWCLNGAEHKGGVPGGVGPFTKRQVMATLAHGRGGHLRK